MFKKIEIILSLGIFIAIIGLITYEYNHFVSDPEIKDRKNLTEAIKNNNIGKFKKLYKNKVKIFEMQSASSRFPLDEASVYCRTEIASFLIKNGTDIHIKKGRHSSTALHVAAYNGCNEIVILLINAGARINEKNSQGEITEAPSCNN